MKRNTIPDHDLNQFMNSIYNGWFRKWKTTPYEKWVWNDIISEANTTGEKYAKYQAAQDLVAAFTNELSRRWQNWCDEREKEEK